MGLLYILFALVIIGLVYYFATRNMARTADPSNKSYLKDAGVDASSYKGILDSTKKVIKDADQSRGQVP